jgi:hypothetical protein
MEKLFSRRMAVIFTITVFVICQWGTGKINPRRGAAGVVPEFSSPERGFSVIHPGTPYP